MEESKTQGFRAALKCLETATPFCLFQPEGENSPIFFANPSFPDVPKVKDGDAPRFFIGRWGDKSRLFLTIHPEVSTEQLLEMELPHRELKQPLQCSTLPSDYLEGVEKAIASMRPESAEKVVISRIKTIESKRSANFYMELARRLFDAFPHSFRFLYFTPQTGAWIGASPELLLKHDSSTGQVATMALAGTRNAQGDDTPWDSKNVREHALVDRFIRNLLDSRGLKISKDSIQTLKSGNIEHICAIIEAWDLDRKVDSWEILDSLNPTPAICGFPREKAMGTIASTEKHRRECYGGVVGFQAHGVFEAYVNLRCATFNSEGITLFAGGGILPESDPQAEWLETERKMQAIGQFLNLSTTDYNE